MSAVMSPRAAPGRPDPRPAAAVRPAPRLVPSITAPVAPGERRLGKGLEWTPDELKVLRERYVAGGALACAPFLPGRAFSAIRARAGKLGLRTQAGYQRQAPSDARLDAAIRALYSKGKPQNGVMAAFCIQHQRPRQWVRAQAIRLGAIRHVRGRNWTPAEDAILEAKEGYGPRSMQKALIAAGFSDRSESAIAERCRRLGYDALAERGYTAHEIAGLLGEDSKLVARWITQGKLAAKAENDANGVISAWRVQHKALRDFLIENPSQWQPARVDRFWLIDTLAGRLGPRT
jgi:hypothetical protein